MNHQELREEKLAYWQPHIAQWQSSGMKSKDYCQQHRLDIHRFKYWQYQIAPETKKKSKSASKKLYLFSEVKNSISDATLLSKDFELHIGTQFSLKIPTNFNATALINLLKVMVDLAC